MRVISIKILPNYVLKLVVFLLTIYIIDSCSLKHKEEVNSIFDKVNRIEILAYVDRNQWNQEDNPDYLKLNFIQNGKLKISKKYLKNRISLKSRFVVFEIFLNFLQAKNCQSLKCRKPFLCNLIFSI